MTAGSPPRSNPGGRDGPGTPDNLAQWARERAEALTVEARYRDYAANWAKNARPSKPTHDCLRSHLMSSVPIDPDGDGTEEVSYATNTTLATPGFVVGLQTRVELTACDTP